MISYHNGVKVKPEECSSIRISMFWRKNKYRQEKGSPISVFKPKRLQISHSPTLNFTDKGLRLKDLRVSDRVSPESRVLNLGHTLLSGKYLKIIMLRLSFGPTKSECQGVGFLQSYIQSSPK